MLKRVLMSVDLPRPDSPMSGVCQNGSGVAKCNMTTRRTDNHGGELETLAHALPMDLVRQVGKANIAVELLANDGWDGRVSGLGKRRGGTVHLARGTVGGDGVAVGSGGHVGVRHLK